MDRARIAGGLCCLVLAAVARSVAADEEKKPPETYTVAPGPFQVSVDLEGIFESQQMSEVVLRPDVYSGLEVDKAVPQGTLVKKGEPIIWLETDKIDQQLKNMEFDLEQSKLSLAQAELELQSAEAAAPIDLRAAERAKEVADKELEHYLKVDAEMSARSAAESLKGSEYQLEYAQEELSQLEQMYKADDLTEQTEEIVLKRARRDVERAEFFLEFARIRHERTINEALPRQKVEMQDANERAALALKRAQETIPRGVEEKRISLQKQTFNFERQTRDYEKLKADRELMVVEAPAAGVVYYGHCDRGRWPAAVAMSKQLRKGGNLGTNQVIMTIVAPGPGFVRTDVPEASVRFMTPGTGVTITPAAYPRARIAGTFTAVDPIPISEGKFDGQIAMTGDIGSASIVPGMTCSIKVSAYSRTDALAVPKSAVFSEEVDDDQKYVYVAPAEGEPRKQSVEVGETSGDRVEILSGLAAGDKILLKKPDSAK